MGGLARFGNLHFVFLCLAIVSDFPRYLLQFLICRCIKHFFLRATGACGMLGNDVMSVLVFMQ
jgi:hypothetical protein